MPESEIDQPELHSPRVPFYRPAGRVIVLDTRDRVLLFRTNFRDRPLWITPGGGVESGESFQDAARRELWEETGITAELGPCVWLRRHVFEFKGVLLDEVERFFIVRLEEDVSVNSDNWVSDDHFMTGHHWWSVDEISASSDYFAPRHLATLLGPLLGNDYPQEPFDCGV